MADARGYDHNNDDYNLQRHNAPHADDAPPSAGTSVFSTSSVDQFLRDNGFNLEDHGGADLSSMSGGDDDDSLEQQFDLLRSHGVEYGSVLQQQGDVRGGEDEEEGETASPRHGHSFRGTQSASEEEEPTTPRFTLFHEEDAKDLRILSDGDDADEEERRSGRNQRQSEQAGDAVDENSLDRSMILGTRSMFSDELSSTGTGEHSRIAQSLQEEEGELHAARREPSSVQQGPLTPAPSHREFQPKLMRPHRVSSSRSSSPSSSLPSSFSTGSHRVQDDELSDALGVTASTPDHEASAIMRASSSVRASKRSSAVQRHSNVARTTPGTVLRSLFHAQEEEEEQKENESMGMNTGAATRQHEQSGVSDSNLPSRQRISTAQEAKEEEPFSESEVGERSWSALNDLLRKNGLQVMQLQKVDVRALRTSEDGEVTIPVRESLFNLVQDMALQLERKNQIIQDIILESNRNSKEHSRAEGNLASIEKKNEDIQNTLSTAKAEIVRLKARHCCVLIYAIHYQEDANEQAKKLKQSCLKLQQQLKVSEHRVKAKEVLVDRMQQKLQQQVDKESLNKTRDRQVFRQIQQRDARKANARDNQSLEYISVYEAQREQMQEEIDQLKSQVTALNAELRDKENYIARKATAAREMSIAWDDEVDNQNVASPVYSSYERRRNTPTSVASDDMILERLEAARREQEQAAAKLRRREAAMIKKVSMIEQELLLAHETIGELKEENANLVLEAESRPSIRDYRLSQRRIHQLEHQVSESKLALEEATDLHELRKYMGTKELIERDRLNHRLHLNRLNTLPRETTLEVVKEVCRVLNLTDITLIAPSLEKLCHVVAAVPRMEKFIRDVCGFVFLSLHEDVDAQNVNTFGFELEQVLPTLQQWSSERRKLHALEEFKTAIVSELCKRSVEPSILSDDKENGNAQSTRTTLSRAIHIVSELVELEKNVLHHREIYSQAATEIEIEEDGASPRSPDMERRKNTAPNVSARSEEPNFVVEKNSKADRAGGSAGLAGVREVREMSILIRELKRELGAATMREILPRTKRLMELLSLSIHNNSVDEDDD
ncbi:hypothetical protein FI667_g2003, partial [Globisporangium splendens]